MLSEPRSLACRTNSRPGRPAVTIGGTSRPVKWRCGTVEWPTSTSMYAPETRVPSPEMLAPGDARAHHPEAGILDQITARVAVNARLHDDLLAVLGDVDFLDLADLDRFVADLGLVRLEIVGGVEGDLDARALLDLLAHRDEHAGDHHDHRQYPDVRQAHAAGRVGDGGRQIVEGRARRLSHGSWRPKAGARRRIGRRAW